MTARTWITSALRLIGVLATGETPEAAAADSALTAASDMLDGWAAERLTIYSQTRSLCALVANQQRYTVGTGGNWTQDRPLWIDGVGLLTADGVETPIKLFTRDEWQAIDQKGVTSATPEGIFYNPTYPLAAVDVWPKPTDASAQIVIYAPLSPLKSVATLDTAISAPEGWAKALRYNLALELAPEYGVEPSAAVVNGAMESKATIKRVNEGLLDELKIDRALLGNPVWSNARNDFNDF
jgi:hypothetical protein